MFCLPYFLSLFWTKKYDTKLQTIRYIKSRPNIFIQTVLSKVRNGYNSNSKLNIKYFIMYTAIENVKDKKLFLK